MTGIMVFGSNMNSLHGGHTKTMYPFIDYLESPLQHRKLLLKKPVQFLVDSLVCCSLSCVITQTDMEWS
jgi:hypothetical protein